LLKDLGAALPGGAYTPEGARAVLAATLPVAGEKRPPLVPGAAAAGAGAGGGGAAAAEEAAAAAAALFGGPVEKPDCLCVEGMPRGVLAELDTPNEAPGGGSSSAGAGGKSSGGADGEEEKKPWQKRDAAVAAVTAAMERAAGLGGVKVRVLAGARCPC
jgi:hypothetical protein